MTHRSIHWFRKGLRLHDNPALLAAMKDCAELHPIFILDPWFPRNMKVSVNRWRFLIEALKDLDENLKKINSRLFVVRGKPAEVFPMLFKKWKVTRLTFEVDTEPYSKQRDAEVERLAAEHNVEVIQRVSNTLYDVERVIAENNGKPPLTYVRLQTVLASIGPPKRPYNAPTKDDMKDCCTPWKSTYNEKYGVPTLEELGQDSSQLGPHLYPGGETEAVQRLDLYMKRTAWVCNFQKPDTAPNSLTPSTTVLSPYMKFGCLSARTFYWRVAEIYQGPQLHWTVDDGSIQFNQMNENCSVLSSGFLFIHKLKHNCYHVLAPDEWCYQTTKPVELIEAVSGFTKKHSSPPVSLHGQLLWREFYYVAGAGIPNFDKMEGNSVCVQVDWDENKEHLKAWSEARTGFPFIDAIMTQLRTEGWIHHLARHAVACFLTRGDLWISWEEGQKVFEELLLDADWALNAGNWLWLSASAFFHQFFRVYSPVAFGKKTDKNGDYIKKYLPFMRKFPAEYIYEPWKAPRSIQERAGCIIGKDYPKPIVVHETVSKQNIQRMKAAYARRSGGGEKETEKGSAKNGQKRKSPSVADLLKKKRS